MCTIMFVFVFYLHPFSIHSLTLHFLTLHYFSLHFPYVISQQVTARRRSLPVETYTLETYATRMYRATDANVLAVYPEDGIFIHGLYLEGARWTEDSEATDTAYLVSGQSSLTVESNSRVKEKSQLLCNISTTSPSSSLQSSLDAQTKLSNLIFYFPWSPHLSSPSLSTTLGPSFPSDSLPSSSSSISSPLSTLSLPPPHIFRRYVCGIFDGMSVQAPLFPNACYVR